MDCGNFEVKDEPAASRVVTNVVYAVLFVFLGSLIVSGPVRRLGSEETKFKESYADPQELPAPAVTLCELGVRQRVAVPRYKTFYLPPTTNGSHSGDSAVQFKTLPDFYLACHLHDAFHGPEYFPPAWAPEVEDWTETPGDMVLSGNCYSLDLSEERGPGEGFYLALAVEDRNQTELQSPATYYIGLRDAADDFLAAPMVNEELGSKHFFLETGQIKHLQLQPSIIKHLDNCDERESFTGCIDEYLDARVAGCTGQQFRERKCKDEDYGKRRDLLVGLRKKDYVYLTNATGCKKTCTQRKYDLHEWSTMPGSVALGPDSKESIVGMHYQGGDRVLMLVEEKVYGLTDFQADVGGLSGLLLGLSIIELFSRIKYRCITVWRNKK